MSRYNVRCVSCRARRIMAKHPDEYVRPPRCACGSKRWTPDAWQNKHDTSLNGEGCSCNGYHFTHRRGSKFCFYRRDGVLRQPGDDDFHDRQMTAEEIEEEASGRGNDFWERPEKCMTVEEHILETLKEGHMTVRQMLEHFEASKRQTQWAVAKLHYRRAIHIHAFVSYSGGTAHGKPPRIWALGAGRDAVLIKQDKRKIGRESSARQRKRATMKEQAGNPFTLLGLATKKVLTRKRKL